MKAKSLSDLGYYFKAGRDDLTQSEGLLENQGHSDVHLRALDGLNTQRGELGYKREGLEGSDQLVNHFSGMDKLDGGNGVDEETKMDEIYEQDHHVDQLDHQIKTLDHQGNKVTSQTDKSNHSDLVSDQNDNSIHKIIKLKLEEDQQDRRNNTEDYLDTQNHPSTQKDPSNRIKNDLISKENDLQADQGNLETQETEKSHQQTNTPKDEIESHPEERQSLNYHSIQLRIVDTFFSIHDLHTDKVLYVSEIKYREMNPSFSEFDLSCYNCAKFDTFTIKIWCLKNKKWVLLINVNLSLANLIFIGEKLDQDLVKDDNSIIIELTDGFYAVPNAQNTTKAVLPNLTADLIHPRASSSFDQLMKLNNLQSCIKDSEKNKLVLSKKISQELEAGTSEKILTNSIQLYTIKTNGLKKKLGTLKEEIGRLELKIESSRVTSQKFKLVISDLDKLTNDTRDAFGIVVNNEKMAEETLKQVKIKTISQLRNLFPIQQVNNYSNEFMILGHRLPLSIRHLTKNGFEQIAFILNLVALLVNWLSYYLLIPLRYPVEIFGSHSYINDPISQLSVSMFPLWIKNLHNVEKFEYALLLLNKNIEQLLESIGMRVIDHRNLLGNLNILFICLSDNDEPSIDSTNGAIIKRRLQLIKKKKSQLFQQQQQQQQHHQQHHQLVV